MPSILTRTCTAADAVPRLAAAVSRFHGFEHRQYVYRIVRPVEHEELADLAGVARALAHLSVPNMYNTRRACQGSGDDGAPPV